MSKARYLPKRDYEGLKAVSRDLVEAAGGSKRVCELTRACPSRLSEALAPQCEDRFLAIDQVADLEADVGTAIVTKHLADILGCDVVPREGSPTSETLPALVANVARQATDVTAAFLNAESDGAVTEAERDLLRIEVAEALDALTKLDDALRPERKLRAVP